MKQRLLRLCLVAALPVMASIILVMPALAIELPDSDPTIQSIHVYRHLLETDDFLIVAYFNLPYADIPDVPATEAFIWQLIDGTTGEVLGSTVGYAYVYYGYGYQVISMYFDAATGLDWDPTPPYTLRLRGNPLQFDDPPIYNFGVNSGDYTTLTETADIQAALADDIIFIAEDLDLKWGLEYSLLAEDETGTTLSTFGQAYFRGTIYGIQAMAPALFPLAVQNIDLEDREWTDAYLEALDEQYEGTWIETAKAAGGELFGLDYDLVSLIILLAMCAGLVIANVYLTSDHWNGLIDVAFLLVVAAKISLIGLGYVALLAAIAVLYFSLRIWGLIRG